MSVTEEKRATFTPGPWMLSTSIHEEEHGDQEYSHITAIKKHSDIGMIKVAKYDPIRSMDVANARLIAAAPEMYAQCKLFERVCVELLMQGETGGYEELEKLTRVSAILAKIDGGEG